MAPETRMPLPMPPRSTIANNLDDTLIVRRGRNRRTSSSSLYRRRRNRANHDGPNRRGHIYREGRRRVETASARVARVEPEQTTTRSARGWTKHWRSSAHATNTIRVYADLLRERPVEAGGSAVRRADRAPGQIVCTPRVRRGCRTIMIRRKACSVRCGGRARRHLAAGDGGPVDRLRNADHRQLAEWRSSRSSGGVRQRSPRP